MVIPLVYQHSVATCLSPSDPTSGLAKLLFNLERLSQSLFFLTGSALPNDFHIICVQNNMNMSNHIRLIKS